MFNDTIVSLIRTWVPMAAGFIAAQLLGLGIEGDASAIEQAVTPIVMGAYYVIARGLERAHPAFGWLLGVPKAPSY